MGHLFPEPTSVSPSRAPAGVKGSASSSAESVALSKELKRRGWKFVKPTTVYAFLQAKGLFNDHATECAIRAETECARQSFNKP
ncbi:DNA-3-methyladenine glycosylase I [Pseudomonas sp. GOM7]|uniref:DNA-3-methyladenine glycosylase I n=1 Tax=Pseudomonas sp. GOM7 TaxID=2998079 RepID=UPI00227A03FF|nr:DNA-3-methyladenine glycosylase I [Pseudomonas sp. GOM7]WAJ38923.1 DNA-3-methyladenine glycosylase I [Pseudomonas sp. GOM7]